MQIKKPTDSFIDRRHRELWDAAIEEYGEASAVPNDIARDFGEEVRALYVLALAWDGTGSPHSVLRTYGVLPHIIAKLAGEPESRQRHETRREKYDRLISFAKANLYKEFTVAQLAKESGLSSSTIISWARSTGWFRSSGERGLWEARNPADDRRAEG